MPGPWEKFQNSAAPESQPEGPWSKFQTQVSAPQASGEQVYEKPVGPEQASAVDRFKERVQDPERWKAVLNNTGAYADKSIVAGTPPMAIPGTAIPKVAQAATALAEGQGLGYLAGRTALSTAQGAVMSAADRKKGESWQDTIDRAKEGAKLSGGIQLAAESLPVIGKVAGAVTRKIGSALSGVDENIIKNYASRTDEVNSLIKKSGGDMTAAADQVRTELSDGIQKTKKALNSQITVALNKASPEKNVSIQPLIDQLEASKVKLNPNYKADAIADIDEMIAAIKSDAGPEGMVNAAGLYQAKQFLNEGSKGAYNKGGQIFTRASEAAQAAKSAAGKARAIIGTVSKDVSAADGQLSKLHAIEGRLNRNLLAPGKPDGALFAAGSGANPRNAATLRSLEEISGVPVSQRANDLATAKTFANPSLLPSDSTGKIVGRIAAGAGVGYLADGEKGAYIGGAVASPMALKAGINAANYAKSFASKLPSLGKLIRENPIAAQTIVQLTSGQIRRANEPAPELTPEVNDYFQQNPQLLQNVKDPAIRAQLQKGTSRGPAERGEAKWASNGLSKLGIQDQELKVQLLQSKEGKRLLIEASDLPAGSARMQRINEKIQKQWGKNAQKSH